jgi:hypothetical protein
MGLAQGPERRDPQDAPLVGVDRDALDALEEEEPEHAERRPAFRRRRPDDRDSARRPQDRGDLLVACDRDRATLLLEVEERDRPLPLLAIGGPPIVVGQVAPSLT